jgi:chromosome segregation protein
VRFTKLRLLGFKSFVEPTEFLIEDGLTGIVGPNGCGKSNLVEALRWVMGESSYKNMRASGMDDVIFSGSSNRPARNTAEVGLFLDNADRTAPAAFNDAEELQVTRRIEREAGSAYRINGKEVRAKDVQLLFADASTGARSPSMVGQGRIGELISAKPQARRALLEEAAGISGLHSRRHEAELRLRAAEQNLERLDDVVAQLDAQIDNLKRQARQANRYRTISAEIRRTEAMLFHLRWAAAKQSEAEAQSALTAATQLAGQKAEIQANAAKEQAVAALKLPELRDGEARAAAALQRLTIARNQIDEEVERLKARRRELEQRLAQLDADIAREQALISDNAATLERLAQEAADLTGEGENTAEREASIAAALGDAGARLTDAENGFGEITARVAQERTGKAQFEKNLREAAERGRRVFGQLGQVETELQQVVEKIAALGGSDALRERFALLEKRAEDIETDTVSAERELDAARTAEQEARMPLSQAEAALNAIETEARTINRILNQGGQDLFPGVVERIRVERGFETALGAALGEDLDAPVDRSAPAHWELVAREGDPQLPDGVRRLADLVDAPAELARRLAQVGVVAKEEGARLQGRLKPGQRLVSREGDLWRWDGYVAGAEAPTAAAQKLAQRNRLAELDRAALEQSAAVAAARDAHAEARARLATAGDTEKAVRETWRVVQHELAAARDELAAAERSVGQYANRRATLEEARNRLAADLSDSRAAEAEAEASLAAIPPLDALEAELDRARTKVAEERAVVAQLRAEAEGMAREAQQRERRLSAIAGEIKGWQDRAANAETHVANLDERRAKAAAELAAGEDAPFELEARRRALQNEIDAAGAARSQAADRLAEAETALAEADKRARQALAELSEAREERVRAEERVSAAQVRRSETEGRIREELGCEPEEALAVAETKPGESLPEAVATERNLERLKAERERLGAVNLRAETEQNEITEQRDALVKERDDLIEAIRRLRQGIGSLNREGRERLLEAFDVVNGHFQRLFSTLFGGGTAELQLIESDDPLEAGLEILARPPGKKPQTMTLLSGGEQALTAMALIFAVFLTNPAPICVLDEVDAPLDDHNVERFCDMMDQMAQSTDTRFVIITHNPITMSRMNRLFGVTMAERGVSQLVSVNLEQAERLAEAS